jgi:hypothetical protein
MKTLLATLLCCVLTIGLRAQPTDFTAIDAHARSVRKSTVNVDELTAAVIKPARTDQEKARAIFVWITEYIAYDCQARSVLLRNPYVTPEEKAKQVQTTLRTRRGVCDDYCALFKAMCEKAGLEAVMIPGWAKTTMQEIGAPLAAREDHAWNAVRLQGQWRLLDVTWAAGHANCGENKFTKDFLDGYFLTGPTQFALTHFPVDPAWQLLPEPVSRKAYSAFPLVHSNYLEHGVQAFFPQNGVLTAGKAALRFGVKMPPTKALLFLIADNKLIETAPAYENGHYVFQPKLERLPKFLSVAVQNAAGNFEHMVTYRVQK